MEFKMAMEKANKVKAAVIASLDANCKTVKGKARRVKRIANANRQIVGLGILTGTVAASVIVGSSAMLVHSLKKPAETFVFPEETDVVITTTEQFADVPIIEEEESIPAVTTTTIAPTEDPDEVMTTTAELPAEVIPYELTEPNVEYASNDQETEEADEETYETSDSYYISDSDLYLLANLVGREYGADWVSVHEKARVVACVMNRVNNDSNHPEFDGINSVSAALNQAGQFPGWLPDSYYTDQVTESCIDAVFYYFANASAFSYDYYYYGDGTYNYFRYYY